MVFFRLREWGIAAALAMGHSLACAQQAHPFPSDDAISKAASKAQNDHRRVFGTPTLENQPNSFPQFSTPTAGGVDLEAVAKQYQAQVPELKQDELFVFASFSMPKASLERLMADAAKVSAVVVFRGFKNNSWKETADAVASLKNEGVNAVVNPNAFKAFKVNVVPVVVIAAPSALQQLDDDGCAPEREFVSVQGDVTLDYALEHMAKKSPRFSGPSQRYMKAIRGSL